MRVVASGSKSTYVEVDTVLVSAVISSTGCSEEACREQAMGIVAEIIENYGSSYNNVVGCSVDMERIRCVDGNGNITVDHKCIFEIRQKGEELLSSLNALEWACIEMADWITITEWESFPSSDVVRSAVQKLIEGAYSDAEFEAKCTTGLLNEKGLAVTDVAIKDLNYEPLRDYVCLPDTSNTERDIMFENLGKIVPLYKKIGRSVTVTMEC